MNFIEFNGNQYRAQSGTFALKFHEEITKISP